MDTDVLPTRRARRRPKRDPVTRFLAAVMSAGRGVVYLVMAVALLLSLGLGVANSIDNTAPIVWGTYTEERCEKQLRRSCSSIGTWVSDDGQIVRVDVRLDGSPGPDGTVRAGYRPDGILSAQRVVHVETWINAGPVVCFGTALWVAVIIGCVAKKWGHLRWWQNRRRRITDGANPQPALAD